MKVVFSDVDGTFQELGKPIPHVNIEAVNALQEAGHRFVFVSGRNYQQIKMVLTESNLDCDLIFSNGAGFKLRGEDPRFTKTLTLDQFKFIVKILEENQMFYHVHTSVETYLKPIHHYTDHLKQLRLDLAFMGQQGIEAMDFKEDYFTNVCEHHEDLVSYFEKHPEIKLLKVELMEGNDQNRDRLKGIFEEAGYSAFSTFPTVLEIIDPQSNKGAAIEGYIQQFDKVTSYGIGDGDNDLSMFAAVDVSVAVGNAPQAIQEKCDLVVRDCKDGGVGHFIFEQIID
ncbi:HAD family hydrolase [uncultured Vagococcus sp.]|uniref:HAD family hydrolase n=1 Tax=uncultured Vagococcus sp. TaxID=189676 RepID=UPI0028D5C0C8|nr:HAD family hydrolase [uncultured Vagococcus sp.]